jgi:hypothetical protein
MSSLERRVDMEYRVESKWCGFWGGWGSERDLAGICNAVAGEGWRLIKTERAWFAWFWFLPRPKVLLIFERAAP